MERGILFLFLTTFIAVITELLWLFIFGEYYQVFDLVWWGVTLITIPISLKLSDIIDKKL